jgi:hypothetical protein
MALHRAAIVAVALGLSLSVAWGTLALRRVAVPAAPAPALHVPGRLERGPGSGGQRAVDRVIEQEVRRAIRADPSLGRAGRLVKVTSRRGVVRLVGRVGTAKERSSLAFKAGQSAWGGRVDNRLTVGDRAF